MAKQGLLFLLGENQKKGKRDREAFSVGIAGAKASGAEKASISSFRPISISYVAYKVRRK